MFDLGNSGLVVEKDIRLKIILKAPEIYICRPASADIVITDHQFRMVEALHIKKDFLFNMMFWTIIFGIIGARVYYVLFNIEYYMEYKAEIIKIWNGGLAIHGAIIAGLITVIVYCNKYKVNTRKILDICAPALLISQGIGRWGNFFNQEAFGTAVNYHTLANIRIIPQFVIDNMYIDGAYHLPMFYFESLLCLLGFIIMLFIRRRKYIHNGQVFAFYLIWYG